jgi:hypothetical protein
MEFIRERMRKPAPDLDYPTEVIDGIISRGPIYTDNRHDLTYPSEIRAGFAWIPIVLLMEVNDNQSH